MQMRQRVLPASIQNADTHGVCEGSPGHIYVHHTINASSESSDSTLVDHKGMFVKSWGKQVKGGAHGTGGLSRKIHVSSQGFDHEGKLRGGVGGSKASE
jgi:hypothetical protein